MLNIPDIRRMTYILELSMPRWRSFGKGSFADLSSTQTVSGAKTFTIVPKSSQDASATTDLVRKSQYDSGLEREGLTSNLLHLRCRIWPRSYWVGGWIGRPSTAARSAKLR
jgi:hypothetical protein